MTCTLRDMIGTSLRAAAFAAGLCAGVAAFPALGESVACPDPLFTVDAGEPATALRLCTLAQDIRGRLEACGLEQSRVLHIEPVDGISHPLGDCLAYFDCEFDLIRITTPSAYAQLMSDDQPYAALPTDVILRALLTHEMAHALVSQGADDRRIPMVDQEYIAAAMELEFMAERWRDVLISLAPVGLPPKEGLIDIWIYGLAPRKFGVNAWQHFSLPGNGCTLVRRIVAGETSFSKEARPELR